MGRSLAHSYCLLIFFGANCISKFSLCSNYSTIANWIGTISLFNSADGINLYVMALMCGMSWGKA